MVRYADASLQTSIPTVDAVLEHHASALGNDLIAYRNHVYRLVNLSLAIAGVDPVDLEKIAVAAVFHDLGIWTNDTFDYIAPSVALARDHLVARARADWIPEVEAMIVDHHKIRPPQANRASLVEPFRRADWIDVSRGLRTFGVPRSFIASAFRVWPSAGFHWRLLQLTFDWFLKHPLHPLPMVRF
ncbi:MAG: phosphohydrolase [Methanobacteriota archaeon]|nr:MAG: phosphohydrolase [Euryarchaeota archaeon]